MSPQSHRLQGQSLGADLTHMSAGQDGGPSASPTAATPDGNGPADLQAGMAGSRNLSSRAQGMKSHAPGTYHLSGIAGTEQAQLGHPDYVCCLTAASAYLGCLPRHLHYSVCCIEQEMADVERALGTGRRP